MLYDFHKWQNDRRPGTLHATYLVYGTQMKKPDQAEQDGDVEMTDVTSETGQNFSDEVLTHALTLVKEEQLQGELRVPASIYDHASLLTGTRCSTTI